jgi:hypothetical protein
MTNDTRKLCFVIGPIGDAGTEIRTHADWLLEGIIRPVFAEHFSDFNVLRADEIRAPGDINSQIIQKLMDAELVIADMSLHNANAFYELAVRHMVRLPTIHVIHHDWKIPFDVAPYRAIHFSRKEFSDVSKARSELVSVVQEVIAPDFQVENPITHARAKFELDQHATPEIKALADEVASITAKLNALRPDAIYPSTLTPVNPSKFAAFNRSLFDSQSAQLERFLTNNSFRMIFNPANNKSKIVTFDSGGSIVEGRNDNEHRWRIRDGRLEILQSDGNVHSRFVYVPSDRSFQHTNDPDTRSVANQRIELDK